MSNRTGWTLERRARQALAIHEWKPWTRSTGPVTEGGKARAALNARRIGMREVFVYRGRRS